MNRLFFICVLFVFGCGEGQNETPDSDVIVSNDFINSDGCGFPARPIYIYCDGSLVMQVLGRNSPRMGNVWMHPFERVRYANVFTVANFCEVSQQMRNGGIATGDTTFINIAQTNYVNNCAVCLPGQLPLPGPHLVITFCSAD